MNPSNQSAGVALVPLKGGKRLRKRMVFAGLLMSISGILLDVFLVGLPIFSMYLVFPGIILSIVGLAYKTHYLKVDHLGISGHTGKFKFNFKWDQIEDLAVHHDSFRVSNGKQMVNIPFHKMETEGREQLRSAIGTYLADSPTARLGEGNISDEFF